jgi:hypothetical protein
MIVKRACKSPGLRMGEKQNNTYLLLIYQRAECTDDLELLIRSYKHIKGGKTLHKH